MADWNPSVRLTRRSRHWKPPKEPHVEYDPRPFISQNKVSFESPSTIVYDRKFDTALRASHIDAHYTRIRENRITTDDLLIMSFADYPKKRISNDVSCTAHAQVMLHIIEESNTPSSRKFSDQKICEKTARIYELIHKNLLIQIGYLNHNNYLETSVANTMKGFKKITENAVEGLCLMNGLLDYTNWLMGVINMSNAMYSRYFKETLSDPSEYIKKLNILNHATYERLGLKISWCHSYCIISHRNQSYLLPKSYILLLHNKACDMISVLNYSKTAQHSCLPAEAYQTTVNFCTELWRLNVMYGQDFYAIAKTLEAFASAEALIEVEKWDNSEFMRVISKDLNMDTGFDYKTSFIREIWKRASIPFKHELAGLSKISGHPLVNMESGAYKIHKYTTEQYTLNYDKINECTNYVKQNYIRNYILREGKWPPHRVTSSMAPRAIKHSSLLNIDPEGVRAEAQWGKIQITDYNFVELLPNIKYQKLESVIPHLKDKTISIMRSAVVGKYLNKLSRCPKTGWSDTRLLLYYLLHDNAETDHLDILNRYAAGEDIAEFENYLVCRIVPKEGELKEDFRGFGCTTLQNRMIFLTQEKNAMNYLDLHSDEQAMTLSELELTKRLYAFRNFKAAYQRHFILYAMVDASKWNNHFRSETCDDVMKETLDKVFDTKVFGRTHEKYQRTLFYVPDVEGTWSWEGQSGGIEGLNQDTWVITYIAQIKTALSDLDLKFHMLCKGDDLRLAIMVPMEDERAADMSKTKKDVMSRLSEAAKSMGHDIKIYDSYGSERYFNFSKSASVDRVELSQVYRKIFKCYGASNAFLPSFDEYIASTFSNAHSACRVATNVLPCYYVALFWTYYYLLSDEPRTRPSIERAKNRSKTPAQYESDDSYYSSCTDDELVALTLCPGLVGGFPVIYLHNMMVRAESDLLSPFLDIISYCGATGKRNIVNLMERFLVVDKTKKKTWKPLYMDPYCLPINRPITSTQLLRNHLVPALEKVVKNDEVRELIDVINNDPASEKCLKVMDSATRVSAKVFSVLYSCFPEALLQEILRKFDSARSVLELLIIRFRGARKAENLLRQVIYADKRTQRWRISRLHGIHVSNTTNLRGHLIECPAESAAIIRQIAWGKPVDGVTMPPMGHLLTFATSASGVESEHARRHHFSFLVDIPTKFIAEHNNYHFGVGHRRPFLGHTTGTGTVNPQLHLVEKDAVLLRVKNIAELATWTDIETIDDNGVKTNSNIRRLIEVLVKLYTKVPLEVFAPFLGARRSGTIAHHVRTREYRESIMPNSLSNTYQLIQGESNSHVKFHKNKQHFWINFLQCMCHSVGVLQFELNVSPYYTTPELCWVVTDECKFCNRPVEEPAIVIDESLLGRVSFPTLTITTMGINSINVLKQSLTASATRRYNREGHCLELDKVHATLGLFDILTSMNLESIQRIADRYSHHPLSQEGLSIMKSLMPRSKSRIIGQRELTSMDLDTLGSCLIMTIFNVIVNTTRYSSLQELDVALSIAKPQSLPWYSLMYDLGRVGRLPAVVRWICTQAECEDFPHSFTPEQVSSFIGSLCMLAASTLAVTYPIILLSDYELDDVHYQIRKHLFRILWHEFRIMLQKYSGEKTKAEQDKYQMLVSAFLVLHYMHTTQYMIMNPDFSCDASSSELLRDIITIDFEVYDNLAESSCEEVELSLSPMIYTYSRMSGVKVSTIINITTEKMGSLTDEINQLQEEISVEFVCTTVLACIDTVRSLPVDLESHDIFDVEYDDTGLRNYFQEPGVKSSPWYQVLPVMGGAVDEDSTVVIQNINTARRQVRNCHIERPFGFGNDTINKMQFIFSTLNAAPVGTLRHMKIASCGDGIGNGTAFLAEMSSKCSIIFTTKPDDQFTRITPLVAMRSIERKSHQVATEHIREGMYDLSDWSTLEFLGKRYGGCHVYWCDAQPSPGNPISDVYYNMCVYYLTTRFPDSILVMGISLEYPHVVARCCSYLSLHVQHLLIMQTPSTKCYYQAYIVAWGCTVLRPKETLPDETKVSYNMALALSGFLRCCEARRLDEVNTVPRYAVLRPNDDSKFFLSGTLPPLWVSLIAKNMNPDPITADKLTAVKTALNSCALFADAIGKTGMMYNRKLTFLRRSLLDGSQDKARSIQIFDLNYRARRLTICTRILRMEGWNFCLECAISGCDVVDEKEIRAAYLAIVRGFSYRDYHYDVKYTNVYTANMADKSGHVVNYWNSFVEGFEICQTYISWCHTQRSTRKIEQSHKRIHDDRYA